MKSIKFYSKIISALFNRHKKLFGIVLFSAPIIFIILRSLIIPSFNFFLKDLRPKFTEGLVGKVRVLNPLFITTEAERDVTGLIYRGLTKINHEGLAEPDLAENWEIKDNKEYIFNLRQDVYWHDGQKFDADDVVYTINTIEDPDLNVTLKESFKDIKVEKLDAYKVRFVLKEPLAPFLNIISVGIIPNHVNLSRFKPVGTGSFKVKSLNDEKLVLNNGNLEFIFKFYPTIDVAEVALRLGEIQALGGLDSTKKDFFLKWENFTVYESPSYRRYSAVFFNTKSDLFSDKNIRSALAHSTPYDALVREAYPNATESQVLKLRAAPISSNSWVETDNLRKIPFDTEKARNLLDKAGWSLVEGKRMKENNPLKLQILTLNTPLLAKTAETLANEYSKIGVEVSIMPLSAPELKERILRRDFSAILTYQEVPSDPDQYSLWHTTQANQGNITGLSSAKVDKFLEDGRMILEKEKRQEKYQELQKVLLEEYPAVWLYYLPFEYIVTKKMDGINLDNFNLSKDRFSSVENWTVKRKKLI